MSLEIIFSWPHLHYFGKKRMSLLISLLTNLSGFSLSEAITLKIDFSKSQSSWSIKDTKKLKIGNERGEKTSSEQYFTLLKIWYKRITWYIEERAELALHGSLTRCRELGRSAAQIFFSFKFLENYPPNLRNFYFFGILIRHSFNFSYFLKSEKVQNYNLLSLILAFCLLKSRK